MACTRSLINPYYIFGLTSRSTLEDLRKSYYKMALICHPDRGGTDEDMNIIHLAYKYIQNQLENCKEEREFEILEDDFKNFCNNQKERAPPFREIWELSDEKKFHDKFNQKFMEIHHKNCEKSHNPFKDGYGEYMDSSEYSGSNLKADYNNLVQEKPMHEFKQEMIIYKEPKPLPDNYGKYQNLKVTKVYDFGDGIMSDYLKSFSEPEKKDFKFKERTLEDIIKERESL